ncbi:chaplin [Streptomyces sp. ISL-66]
MSDTTHPRVRRVVIACKIVRTERKSGNTVNVIALLNPTFGNTCVNA